MALDDRFTRCRTIGHAWFDCDSDWKTDMGVPLTVRCERCMTERRDTVSRSTGDLVQRHYFYPDGYKRSWEEVMSRSDFRLALLSLRIKEARQSRGNGKQAAS